ncbi:MAG: methyltransferase [Actinomycetes bacterium]
MSEHSREDAYRLDSPAAHRAYYDTWAASYDDDFIGATGYAIPREVARAFMTWSTPADTPVAEIGCGTGQLGLALRHPALDGYDISAGMLAVAARTGTYRDLRSADLTDADATIEARYGGIVSSGTFTLGHLGPADLAGVLRLGLPGALCAIGINAAHYADAGFDNALAGLVGQGRILRIDQREVGSYAVSDIPDEPVNRTVIAVFRLTD